MDLLKDTQEAWIRDFSIAVAPIVKGLLRGTLVRSAAFPLERIEQFQILQFPKGSRDLLALINGEHD